MGEEETKERGMKGTSKGEKKGKEMGCVGGEGKKMGVINQEQNKRERKIMKCKRGMRKNESK